MLTEARKSRGQLGLADCPQVSVQTSVLQIQAPAPPKSALGD